MEPLKDEGGTPLEPFNLNALGEPPERVLDYPDRRDWLNGKPGPYTRLRLELPSESYGLTTIGPLEREYPATMVSIKEIKEHVEIFCILEWHTTRRIGGKIYGFYTKHLSWLWWPDGTPLPESWRGLFSSEEDDFIGHWE